MKIMYFSCAISLKLEHIAHYKAKNQIVKTLFFVRTDTHACTHSNYAAQIYDIASY